MRGFWRALFGGGEEESTSASVAKDRLKVIVTSSERLNVRLTPARIDEMKREILAVVNKFVSGVQIDAVNIKQRHEHNLDMLELSISLPDENEQNDSKRFEKKDDAYEFGKFDKADKSEDKKAESDKKSESTTDKAEQNDGADNKDSK